MHKATEIKHRFVNFQHFSSKGVYSKVRRMKTSGFLHLPELLRRLRRYKSGIDIDILSYFERYHLNSIRSFRSEHNIPKTTAGSVLQRLNWHRYCISALHGLPNEDHERL